MSIAYNLLTPADAQFTDYEVEDDSSYRYQNVMITGTTESGYDVVISKLDTSLIALFTNTSPIREIYNNPKVEPCMKIEEILKKIGFKLPQGSEVMP